MKKYNVEFIVSRQDTTVNESMEDFVLAENEIEAVEFAIDRLFEDIRNNGYNADVENKEIIVYNEDDEIYERYTDFTATEC